MNLFITKSDTRRQLADGGSGYAHYLPHEEEPMDFHREFKDSDFLPMKGGRNLQNLFDDSDVKDYYWFNIVRKYFSRY